MLAPRHEPDTSCFDTVAPFLDVAAWSSGLNGSKVRLCDDDSSSKEEVPEMEAVKMVVKMKMVS